MTNTNNKSEWKFPGEYVVVTENDEPLCSLMYGRRREFEIVARDIATKRGEIVYGYLGNGREAFEPAPSVGMGVTLCWLCDRHAGTIVAVSPSGHRITVREDKATRTDSNGMSQDQSYTFEPNPDGREFVLYRQGNGRYGKGSPRAVIGIRGAYHCYEF